MTPQIFNIKDIQTWNELMDFPCAPFGVFAALNFNFFFASWSLTPAAQGPRASVQARFWPCESDSSGFLRNLFRLLSSRGEDHGVYIC